MWNCDSHERDRTRKSSYCSRKDTGQKDQCHTKDLDINAHALCISFAQLIGTDRFGEHKCQCDCNSYDHCCNMYITPAHTGETSLGPAMKVYDIGILCKRNHKIRDRRADITDHSSGDQKCRHMFDASGYQKDKSCCYQRSDKSGNY